MKIKKIIKSILCVFMLITCFNMNVEAATFSLTASKSTVSPNGTFTVKVGGQSVGRVNLKVENGTISTTSVWIENGYETITVKASTSGKVKVTATPAAGYSDLDGNIYNPGSKTVTVTISSSTSGNTTTKSKDNSLKSLTVSSGTLSPSFNSNTTDYTLELGPEVSKIDIKAIANDSKASVSGNGEVDLTVGENIIKLTCTAENGNPKVYKIKAIVDDAPVVFVKFNDLELGVVRNLDSIPKLNGFEEVLVKIDDKEINGFYNQAQDITLLYLQDENQKDFYLVDSNSKITSKYTILDFNSMKLGLFNVLDELKEKEGFTYQEITVLDKQINGWVFNDPAFSNYSLIYAMDEEGNMNFYQYETTQKTVQLYSNANMTIDKYNEDLNKKDEEITKYKQYLMYSFVGCGVLFILFIISFINANRYKKRLIVKAKRESKVD